MPARGFSSTPSKKRPQAKRRREPSLDERRGQSSQRSAPARAESRRVRESVARERRKVRSGSSALRADTRDVTRNTAAPTRAELERARGVARRQAIEEALARAQRQSSGPSAEGLLAAARGLGGVLKGAAGLAGRALDDAVNLPKNAVQGIYETGAAVLEAAQVDNPVFEAALPGKGSYERGKRLIGGLDDGALGRLLVHGDPKGALKIANEHPLYAGLEVTGTGQVLGRTAGAVGRSGAIGRRAKRATSTKRAPLRVEGTNQRLERRYSPNAIVKGGQVAAERAQARRGLDPTVARGKRRERLLNAEVDEFAAQAEGIRRRGREEAARAGAKIAPVRQGAGATSRGGRARAAADRARSRGLEASSLPGVRGRAERDVVLAAVEGRLRGPATFKADLTRERDRLQAVYLRDRARPKDKRKLSASARQANREQVRQLDRVLGDPKALANAGEVFRAADEYNRHAGKIEADLIAKGALHPEQALAARVRTYGVSVMGLRPAKKGKPGLRDANGRVVPTAEIVAHIEAHGHRMPGFVGQRRDQSGARSYFVNWYGGRKTTDAKKRTGQAAKTGSYDASFNALEQQLVRGQGVSDAIGTFDDFVGRFGSKRRDGEPYTWDEAERTAQQLAEATGIAWTPVRAVPARYDKATREDILEAQGTAPAPGHLDALTTGRLDDALKEPGGKERLARNVVLVPAQQVERFRAHQTTGSSSGAKVGQVATRAFRGTVLPFSTTWLTGNVAEAVLRSVAVGMTPGDALRGRRVMRELRKLDEEAWRQADTRIRGGLLYGSAERLTVRRASEDFAGTRFETPAKAAEFVARLPVMRQTLGGLRAYQRGVFALNRGMEKAFQSGVIGKQARKDAQEITGSWAKAIAMQEDVAREVARGLLGTPKQVQFARAADEILGKYGRFSPSTRRAIQTFAPFLPWFLNAARFVGYALPVKHPVKTALLANVTQTLGEDIEAHRNSVPPGDLQSAIRRKDGGLVNLARYTPFGAFTKGAAGITEPLLPQVDSAVAVLNGRSFTGKPLRTQDGETPTDGKKLWLAFYTLLEGAVPGISIARRAQEGGGTAFDDSNVLSPKVKPGTKRGGAANRILNPVRPTYLSGGASSGGKVPASLQREADALAEQQRSRAAQQEQDALRREADALLELQRRGR